MNSKTENQELINRIDLAIESVSSAIAELEEVKIAMDRNMGIKMLGRSYLYKSNGIVHNGLLLYPERPRVIFAHPGFICWLDPDWVKLK